MVDCCNFRIKCIPALSWKRCDKYVFLQINTHLGNILKSCALLLYKQKAFIQKIV